MTAKLKVLGILHQYNNLAMTLHYNATASPEADTKSWSPSRDVYVSQDVTWVPEPSAASHHTVHTLFPGEQWSWNERKEVDKVMETLSYSEILVLKFLIHWSLRDLDAIKKIVYWLVSSDLTIIPSLESHGTLLMGSYDGNKSLPEAMLTQFYVANMHHWDTMSQYRILVS